MGNYVLDIWYTVPGYPEQLLLPAHAVGGVDEIVLRGHGEGGQVLQQVHRRPA